MIPKADCKDRMLYKISSRNLTFGIYQAEDGGFVGIREKFGQYYLFTEYHYDNGAPYGTVTPIEALGELPPRVENVEGHSVCMGCEVPVTYAPWPEGGSRDVKVAGSTISVTGEWKHLADTKCEKPRPCHRENKELRAWLEGMMDKYYAERKDQP